MDANAQEWALKAYFLRRCVQQAPITHKYSMLTRTYNQSKYNITMLVEGLPLGPYNLKRRIGQGTSGEVWLGLHRASDKLYALKVCSRQNMAEKSYLGKRVGSEITALEKLATAIGDEASVPIIRLEDVLETPEYVVLVLEYLSGGDVIQHLDLWGDFPVEESMKVFYSLVRAVDICHQNGVCHRDIKPENLLMSGGGDMKLADFGLAVSQDPSDDVSAKLAVENWAGSSGYAAPEAHVMGEYDGRPADVYGIGATLYAMVMGEVMGGPSDTWGDDVLVQMRSLPADAVAIIRGTTRLNVEERMTLAMVKRHPAFTRAKRLHESLKKEQEEAEKKSTEGSKVQAPNLWNMSSEMISEDMEEESSYINAHFRRVSSSANMEKLTAESVEPAKESVPVNGTAVRLPTFGSTLNDDDEEEVEDMGWHGMYGDSTPWTMESTVSESPEERPPIHYAVWKQSAPVYVSAPIPPAERAQSSSGDEDEAMDGMSWYTGYQSQPLVASEVSPSQEKGQDEDATLSKSSQLVSVSDAFNDDVDFEEETGADWYITSRTNMTAVVKNPMMFSLHAGVEGAAVPSVEPNRAQRHHTEVFAPAVTTKRDRLSRLSWPSCSHEMNKRKQLRRPSESLQCKV